MFGESVFALIPEREVRAAKLTNRRISGCWEDEMLRRMNTWWVRSSVCSSPDRFAGNLLESSGAAVKRSRLEGRNGILMLDRLWNHVETKGQQQRQQQQPQLHRTLRHNLTVINPR